MDNIYTMHEWHIRIPWGRHEIFYPESQDGDNFLEMKKNILISSTWFLTCVMQYKQLVKYVFENFVIEKWYLLWCKIYIYENFLDV